MKVSKVRYEEVSIDDDLLWFAEQLQKLRDSGIDPLSQHEMMDVREEAGKVFKNTGITYYWIRLAEVISRAYLRRCKKCNWKNLPYEVGEESTGGRRDYSKGLGA